MHRHRTLVWISTWKSQFYEFRYQFRAFGSRFEHIKVQKTIHWGCLKNSMQVTMAVTLILLERENRRALRRQRVFRDRRAAYDDVNLFQIYRVTLPVLLEVIDLVEDIAPYTRRSHAVPASLQVCVALRFLATGSYQLAMETWHLATVSRPFLASSLERPLPFETKPGRL
jgi:hypothetical protein